MPLDIHPEYSAPERKPRLIVPVLVWLGMLLAAIGCVVVPNPAWAQIEAILKLMGAI